MAIVVLAIAAASPSLRAQDEPVPIEELWSRLQNRLNEQEKAALRRQAILDFLDRPESKEAPRHRIVLTAQARLGAEFLRARQIPEAARRFETVRRLLDEDSGFRTDLFGLASIGLAQAAESEGRTLDARKLHREVIERCPETRYSDWAELGLARLETRAPVVGEQLPPLPVVRDQSDRAHRLQELRGGPAILLFVSGPADRARRTSLHRSLEAFDLPRSRIWTFTDRPLPLDEDPDQERVFVSDEGLLSDVALRCRIQATPTWLLLGPDGRLIARNPSPLRLRRLLARWVDRRR